MEFNLHPDAVKSFNSEAESLFKELTCDQINTPKKGENSFRPDYFVYSNLTERDIIGYPKISVIDWVGNEVGLSFCHEGKRIGLYQNNYKRLIKLSENIQRLPQISPIISVYFIKDSVFNWMRGKYLNELSCTMVEYVAQACNKGVIESEIWIPLAYTYIQSEIKIGRVTLKSITKELLNEWLDREGIDEERKEKMKKEFLNEYQEKLQGLAAATLILHAEPRRANEIAVEEAEKAASILRVFSPGVFHPKITSCCTLMGTEYIRMNKIFQTKDNKLLRITEEMINKPYMPWVLKDKFIDMIRRNGLDTLSGVLLQDDKKAFQIQVLNALYIYSRCSLAIAIEDKLIYILVAIESILLKDENEPIQQNIGERMAFLLENTAEERKKVINNVKKVYGVRSSFIHHGKSIDELEVIATFMESAFKFFKILICDINRYENKMKFIERIEEIRLS